MLKKEQKKKKKKKLFAFTVIMMLKEIIFFLRIFSPHCQKAYKINQRKEFDDSCKESVMLTIL